MSDSSPDAHMIQVDCGECSGSGSLHGAYQTVKAQRDSLSTRLSDAGGQMFFMRVEIDKLRAELAGLRTGYDAQNAVIAELRKDAERYRFLCRNAHKFDLIDGDETPEELSQMIDAAMAKEASNG